MHYLNSDETTLWAGVLHWVNCMASGTVYGLTTKEQVLLGTFGSGVLAASGTLTGRELNQIIYLTKKLLWASYTPG